MSDFNFNQAPTKPTILSGGTTYEIVYLKRGTCNVVASLENRSRKSIINMYAKTLIQTPKIMIKTLRSKFIAFISSNWFFRTILLLFVIEAGWLAITSRYPMAFDEGYHFGLIQFFSHHLNPIITHQPSSTYAFGAIEHNPSFLYHYLLSFPYRLISFLTTSLQVQVISLRFINLAFMATSLIYMRKMLRCLQLPRPLINIVLLVFALTPLVTVLAAQINYDNLLILMSSIAVYQTLIIAQRLRERSIDLTRIISVLCLCLFASLVNFPFLPIFLGIILVLAWQLASYRRKDKTNFAAQLGSSYAAIRVRTKLILLVIGVIGGSLFMTYYGYDIIKYHSPVPQCNQILNIQDCKQYYAWDRNYTVLQYEKSHPVKHMMNPLSYTLFWFRVEYYQLFGEIIPTGGLVYIARVFYVTVMVVSAIAAMCAILTFRQIVKRYKAVPLVTMIAATYLTALWLRNYHDYLQLRQPLAIQGRYLVPVLLYFYILFGLGIMLAFESKRKVRIVFRPALATVIVVSFIYFGGYVRYASNISPSDGWLKSSSQMASIHKQNLNHRIVATPIISYSVLYKI